MGKQRCTFSFQSVYNAWLENIKTITPFGCLEACLSDITAYSERIEQVKEWQKDAIDIIEDENHLNDWNNDFASYIRYCERLRELKEQEITVITGEPERSYHRQEITLLMEHITPQEMIAFTSLFDRINDFYSVKRSPKFLLTFYSLIYRENSVASIGALDVLDFTKRFTAMEMLRTYLLIEHGINDILKIKPVSKSIRTECLEIYLKERIRCMREKNSDEDDTRPYPLTDLECMQAIYLKDSAFFKAFTEVRNDKELNDQLMDESYHSEQLSAEMQNYRLKVEQFRKAYGLSYKVVSKEEIMPVGDDLIEHMHKLMECYIRLLVDKINEAAPKASAVHPDTKPTKEDLENLFTFKYRRTQWYNDLIEYLQGEKNKIGKSADADWRRHALVLFNHRFEIMTKKMRPNTFKEWLDTFCDLFGRPRVAYLEPEKVRKAKKQSPVDVYIPVN